MMTPYPQIVYTPKQTLYNFGNLSLSKHAYDRIVSRRIRTDEIICSWKSQSTLCRKTRDNRTIYSNFEYGLFIVMDNNTNIIITIIKMEWRKHRKGRYNLEKKYGVSTTVLPVPIAC